MPQMTIFECQKDKNMTRVKNKVINVKVVLDVYIVTLTIVPEILIPQLYIKKKNGTSLRTLKFKF
jgi:hypothetical protein